MMSNVTRVQTKGKIIVDQVYESPVDQYQLRARRRNLLILVAVVILVFVIRRWLT
jgi:hypothetical protein